MKPIHGRVAGLVLSMSLACAVPQLLAKRKDAAANSNPSEQKRAVHALNRLTFGPRPGDVQRVMAMGVDAWIDQQLHPAKINDAALEARLAPFRALRMSPREVAENFPDGGLVKQVIDGKKSMPSDPAKRAVYQVQIARQEQKQEEKRERKAEAGGNSAGTSPASAKNGVEVTAERTAESAVPKAASSSGESTNISMSGASDSAANASPTMESAANADAGNGMISATPRPDSSATSSNPVAGSTAASASEGSAPPQSAPAAMKPADDPAARRREERLYADLEVVQKLPDLPPDQRYKKVLAMSVDDQVAFADSLRGGKGKDFLAGMDAKQKETLQAMNNPQGVVADELLQAKVLRAVYSERQLDEVMTDFWFNHFNVYLGKGADRLMLANYEQDVIRPRAMGKFEDLLVATAKSPAMLFYLDNWLSVGPNSMKALGIPAGRPYGPYRFPPRIPRPNAKKSGLNENYGRELLELHTLSVNGGYSQRDVTEAAKVFTGWTIDKPNDGGGFKYDPSMHEPGPKFVLGHHIKPKGEGEGMELLHRLATSPQTAHFISLKLAQRFVTDDPPEELVDHMAKTFLKKKGDIREVLSELFHSPEFWAAGTYRAKVKTPLEFVASAVRVTGAEVEDALPLARQLGNMGMPLYGAQPPTGYSMKAETWVNSSALLNRMNFAIALSSGKIKGVKVDVAQLAEGTGPPGDATIALSALETKLLAADVSKQTHDSIMAQIEATSTSTAPKLPDKKGPQRKTPDRARPPDVNTMAGLLLGSPEFQRR